MQLAFLMFSLTTSINSNIGSDHNMEKNSTIERDAYAIHISGQTESSFSNLLWDE